MSAKSTKLTQGSVGKNIVFFALPLLVSGFLQQLYHTVDLVFVGRFVGVEAAAAVGASTLMVVCVIGLFMGLSVGAGVVAAMYFGAGDYQRLGQVIHSSMAVTLVGGAASILFGYFMAPICLGWFNTPPDIMPLATTYVRIYFCGLISIVVYNIGTGLIRALGDSKTPMVYLFFGGLLNVAANFWFVYFLGWGVKGSALATVLSTSFTAAMVIIYLVRWPESYGLRLKKLRVDWTELKKVLYIGIPAAFQSVLITLSNIIVQYHINSLGVTPIAAFTAYFKVENVIYLPILAFGQTMTTFAGQNVGARKFLRVKEGAKTALAMGVCLISILSLMAITMAREIFGLFYRDLEVITLGQELVAITFPFYFLYVVLEVLGGTIRGAGKPFPPTLIVLASLCLVRTGLLEIITIFNNTPQGVVMVYPLTWACAAAGLILYYLKANWLKGDLTKDGSPSLSPKGPGHGD
jgi:putative MATE family efflux protein